MMLFLFFASYFDDEPQFCKLTNSFGASRMRCGEWRGEGGNADKKMVPFSGLEPPTHGSQSKKRPADAFCREL